MRILFTNDDGINSDGILKPALALRERGHRVFVVAPDVDRSGVSSCISIMKNPVKLVKLGEDTWSCSGFPTDCVITTLLGALPEKPDLVLSGINRGANLGTDIVYSGTAAAARQASLMGVPSIALSLTGKSPWHWDMAVSWAADHLEELLSFWRKDCFVNVNIPNNPRGPSGLKITWPAIKRYGDALKTMTAPDESLWCFLQPGMEINEQETGSDCDVVAGNFVSVGTVYNFHAVLKELCPSAPERAVITLQKGTP